MATAIALRSDYDDEGLHTHAPRSRDARQVRRLLALAAAYDGASRTEAAAVGGMDRQILRHWAVRFNAEGPEGLISCKATDAKPKLNAAQLAAVIHLVEQGPVTAVHGVVRWRLLDLAGWIYDEYSVSLETTRLGRTLKGLGYGNLAARPRRHGQNEFALDDFKKRHRQDRRNQTHAPRWH